MANGLCERLIGAWKLVSYVEKPVDGSARFYPMGECSGDQNLYLNFGQ